MEEPAKKVMLIEDDRFLSSLIKTRLEKDGLSVIQSFDGDDAIKRLPEERPNLVILDLIMPKDERFRGSEGDIFDARSRTDAGRHREQSCTGLRY